jgi:hypothetical protein
MEVTAHKTYLIKVICLNFSPELTLVLQIEAHLALIILQLDSTTLLSKGTVMLVE